VGAALPTAESQGSFWQRGSKLGFITLQTLLLARGAAVWTLAVTLRRGTDHYFYGTQYTEQK